MNLPFLRNLKLNRRDLALGAFCAIAVSFILPSPGDAPSAKTILEVRGPSLGDGSRIFNCLAYQACAQITPSWETDGETAVTQLEIPLSTEDVVAYLSRCDLSAVKGKLAFVNGKLRQPVRLRAGEAKLDLRPALYGLPDAKSVQAAIARIDGIIAAGDFDGSLQATMEYLGLQRHGYSFEMADNAVRRAWVGGNRMAFPYPEGACELIGFMRHEYEHVQQDGIKSQCAKRGLGNSLEGETRYEFAAHFGDVAAAETFCPHAAPGMSMVHRPYMMPFVMGGL